MSETNLAPSTIGMSAYNWIAVRSGPMATADILAGLRAEWFPELTERSLREALETMVARKRIAMAGDTFDVRDAQRRIVTARERSGDGWEQWRVSDRRAAVRVAKAVALDEVLQ